VQRLEKKATVNNPSIRGFWWLTDEEYEREVKPRKEALKNRVGELIE
jgi:hypothetical protein